MLEYLDTTDSDSDFIPESDTDDTSEEEDAPHATPQMLTLCLTVKRMTWMMKSAGKFCHLSNLSLFLSSYTGPKHIHPPNSPPIAYFHLFFTDLILILMVTESNRYAQQVISSKAGNVPTLLKKWTRITMHHQKANHSIILVLSLFPSHPIVWENVYQASLFPLTALLPPCQQ
jgi:hypothetical protein